jgi:dolichol-phosphate mannosyltransferase
VLFAETRLSSDPGSGLFALRQSVIDGILLQPEGFKMLTEILIRGRWVTLHETPYRFSGRMYGASNATIIQGFRFLRHLRRLWIDTRLRNRDLLKSPDGLSALGPMIDDGDALAAPPAPGSTSS